ncbi:oxidoreductase, aldo/keto reductase family protein [Histomonas meleagridis]|uniref:oxidoreductase, aldo/keto reductase family protein n=1 Tax=Histomonas meleagridis TaxID=135588 RepID=UPI00355AC1DD|nr:oxidoreductase, aldo/keto reductase family protein [Histomonas meleagridis]KAH0801595.1 oxidoreductase, aldo/keto reductase family protein [Histomonas meleagridis]
METIPRVGLGTWAYKSDEETTASVIMAVEKCGYRHIDAAAYYKNEKAVGDGLKDLFARGVIKREEIWVTTKIWNDHHKPEDVEVELRKSLEKLGLSYVDLYLIHWPFATRFDSDGKEVVDHSISVIDTWKAMERMVEIGLTKRIGVANFSVPLLEKLRFADVKIQPYIDQVEYHILMQQEALRMYLKFRGIKFEGYSCLGQGHPEVLNNPVLQEISKEVGKPAGSVALRYLQQLDDNTVVLAKSATESRLKENIDDSFSLTDDQIQRLRAQDKCLRLIKQPIACFGDEW